MEDISRLVSEIESILTTYGEMIEDKKRIYSEILAKTHVAEEDYANKQKVNASHIGHLGEVADRIKEEIVPLEEEKKHLESDLQILVARKSELMIANSELEEANRQFKVYEVTAVAALEAKESELEGKENQLNQKLGLQPKTRILPPR